MFIVRHKYIFGTTYTHEMYIIKKRREEI